MTAPYRALDSDSSRLSGCRRPELRRFNRVRSHLGFKKTVGPPLISSSWTPASTRHEATTAIDPPDGADRACDTSHCTGQVMAEEFQRLGRSRFSTAWSGCLEVERYQDFNAKGDHLPERLGLWKDFHWYGIAFLGKFHALIADTSIDHMLSIEWTATDGWQTPRIIPYQNLSLDPSTCVFHYAFECFEGMKAYKDSTGGIRLFRPNKNMERLNKSSARIALPTVDGDAFTKLIGEFVKTDNRFIPKLVCLRIAL